MQGRRRIFLPFLLRRTPNNFSAALVGMDLPPRGGAGKKSLIRIQLHNVSCCCSTHVVPPTVPDAPTTTFIDQASVFRCSDQPRTYAAGYGVRAPSNSTLSHQSRRPLRRKSEVSVRSMGRKMTINGPAWFISFLICPEFPATPPPQKAVAMKYPPKPAARRRNRRTDKARKYIATPYYG